LVPFQDAAVFKHEFEIAQRINVKLSKGLSPEKAVAAAKAEAKEEKEKAEKNDPDATVETEEEEKKGEEAKKDDA
jgi:hypothetical protein